MDDRLNITLDDLSDNQREIAECIGLEAFEKLVKNFGGSDLYIMSYLEYSKISDNKQFLKDFNGYNFKELSEKYGLTLKTVYNKIPKELRDQKGVRILDKICIVFI